MNKKGTTLLEVLISSIILFLFAAGFYKAFVGSSKIERRTGSVMNAASLASSVLENFSKYQGTGVRRNDSMALVADCKSFETLAADEFSPGDHNIAEIYDSSTGDTLDNFFINSEDQYKLDHNIKADVVYSVTDNTANIFCPASGPGQNDGFRIVAVGVNWEDTHLDNI